MTRKPSQDRPEGPNGAQIPVPAGVELGEQPLPTVAQPGDGQNAEIGTSRIAIF